MFVKVVEHTGKIYYFNVTELSYIIEDTLSCTIAMKNGGFYQFKGELFLPSTD